MFSKCLSLNEIGLENHKNPSITLLNHLDKNQKIIAQVIAELFDEKSVEEILDNDEDISNWKFCMPKWVWKFREVFLKRKSECLLVRKYFVYS